MARKKTNQGFSLDPYFLDDTPRFPSHVGDVDSDDVTETCHCQFPFAGRNDDIRYAGLAGSPALGTVFWIYIAI